MDPRPATDVERPTSRWTGGAVVRSGVDAREVCRPDCVARELVPAFRRIAAISGLVTSALSKDWSSIAPSSRAVRADLSGLRAVVARLRVSTAPELFGRARDGPVAAVVPTVAGEPAPAGRASGAAGAGSSRLRAGIAPIASPPALDRMTSAEEIARRPNPACGLHSSPGAALDAEGELPGPVEETTCLGAPRSCPDCGVPRPLRFPSRTWSGERHGPDAGIPGRSVA